MHNLSLKVTVTTTKNGIQVFTQKGINITNSLTYRELEYLAAQNEQHRAKKISVNGQLYLMVEA